MRPCTTTGLLACVALSAGAARADIVQDGGIFDRAISAYQPIGQTFTAVDAQISQIAFAFSNINPSFPNDPVTMSLYAGEGFDGALLGAVSMTLPSVLPGTSDTPEFIDFDFSGTTLTLGEVYTIAVTTSNSPKIAVVYSTSDLYAGGSYISGDDGLVTSLELNFRVTAVPAPAGVAVLGLGLLGGVRRRRVG